MLRKFTLSSLVSGIKGSFVTPKWSRWFKRLIKVLLAVVVLAVSLHFGVRHLVWPQIETSKPALEKLIGSRLGVTVTMDDVRVSWDGLRPEFEFDGLRFFERGTSNVSGSARNTPVLEIKSISGELSLLSFYHLAPYFQKLVIQDANLTAVRDQAGVVSIAGIALDPNEGGYAGGNWLLAQNAIELSNVVIHWHDLENRS